MLSCQGPNFDGSNTGTFLYYQRVMRPTIKRIAFACAALTILSCGGLNENTGVAPVGFPITGKVVVQASNEFNQNIHILINNEAYVPGGQANTNQVPAATGAGPGQSLRDSVPSFTWNDAGDTKTITVRAGRGGTDIPLHTQTVQYSGLQKQRGARLFVRYIDDASKMVVTVQ